MTRSIRVRIALLVLAVVGICQLALSAFILDRLERVQRDETDALLVEDLAEIQAVLGTPQLQALITAEAGRTSKWNETFVEIRDAAARRVAASPNVPPNGLEPIGLQETRGAIRYSEQVHPGSRAGHRRIRIAESTIGGYVIRVGRSLKSHQRTYWRLRQQLAWGLLAVVALGALGAWWGASRSLEPLRDMTARASELGGFLEGELPRSGRRDELDRLAEVLNDLLERIRIEVQRMRRMTADAAHALRTPVTAIRGTLEVQLQSMDRRSASALAPALEAIEDLSRNVNQLLMLERIESRSGSPKDEPCRLDEIVTDLVDALKVVATDRGIDLDCETAPVTVRGSGDELRNAIANVLDNALRHTPEGGRISVSVHPANGTARLTVLDSGPGLSAEDLERIFERFYSRTGSGTGIGLGLPIARAIAEAHGGRLTASSPGGARFDLELPLLDGGGGRRT